MTTRAAAGVAYTGEGHDLVVLRLEVWPQGDERRARSLGAAIVRDDPAATGRLEGDILTAEGESRAKCSVGFYDGRRPTPWEMVFRLLAGVAFIGVRSNFRYEWGAEAGWWPPVTRAKR